jgi:hypothetical protein
VSQHAPGQSSISCPAGWLLVGAVAHTLSPAARVIVAGFAQCAPRLGLTQQLTGMSVLVYVVAGSGQATNLARMTHWLTVHTASDMKGGALSQAKVSLHAQNTHQAATGAVGIGISCNRSKQHMCSRGMAITNARCRMARHWWAGTATVTVTPANSAGPNIMRSSAACSLAAGCSSAWTCNLIQEQMACSLI